MSDTWVVLVEAERDTVGRVLDVEHLDRLLDLLSAHGPSGLWAVDRYALQFVIDAPTPEAALVIGLSEWREAAERAGLGAWRLVRAELKTPAELEAEHRAAAEEDGPVTVRTPTSEDALRAAYAATRRLLYCRSRSEARGIVTDLARQLGATLTRRATEPGALPLDLSFGGAYNRFPVADPVSMARLDLEDVLPTVMLDAAQAIRLVELPLLVES